MARATDAPIFRALGAANVCELVAGEYKNRRDPSSVCRDIFAGCPWAVELRRAPPSDLRTALVRVKKHLPPSGSRGL